MIKTNEKINKFIQNELAQGSGLKTIDGEESLFEAGLLDSMGILKLVNFIETEYRIKIEINELIPDNFERLNSIAALIASKKS